MNILERIENFANSARHRIAFRSSSGQITYGELSEKSDEIAILIDKCAQSACALNKEPVIIYGHKEPMMIAAMVGCMKAGLPYCPVDTSMPESRIMDIVDAIGNPLIVATADVPEYMSSLSSKPTTGLANIEGLNILRAARPAVAGKGTSCLSKRHNAEAISGDDICYIIFTSGSTGKPKGVEISYAALNNFLAWISDLGGSRHQKEGMVFLNQAPYSFDLSVLDTYQALYCGATVASMDKNTVADSAAMLKFILNQKINYWVSTPSFAEMLLAEKSFNQENFPSVTTFFFCGERLSADMARRLYYAFPDARIYNTYGPTESTVAISGVLISRDMTDARTDGLLPVGEVKTGTSIRILRSDGSLAREGERGEILIGGDTLATGYFRSEELTDRAFEVIDGCRSYHTGDEGYMRGGQLYCVGRMDLQIKMHGYRIELGDIENNILQEPDIESACVVPRKTGDKIRSLAAFVVAPSLEGSFNDAKAIKASLRKRLPEYMIPKKIKFIDSMPMTANGKADRKMLEAMVK